MNPLFKKKANDEQDPIMLPQDDNPQGDMLEPATHQTTPQPMAAKPQQQPITEQERMASKRATGEQSESDITRDEYPLWFVIADALGGEVEPFDVYQGPYVQVPGEGRLFVITPDGLSAQVWNEKTNEISDEFLAESENEAVDAAISVLENPPANTLPYGSEREEQQKSGPDTSEVPDHVPAGRPEDWTPEFSEADKTRMQGLGIKGSKNPLLQKEAAGVPLNVGQYAERGPQTCYKCKQPIHEGEIVSWEGGVEAHAGGCTPSPNSKAQETSRIMFPKGQPKKPMYSSAEKVATRRTIAGFVPATSWGVPQEYAHQVAHALAQAGMRDFDVATDEKEHIAYFSFGNEMEMEVCADLICEYFGAQIQASKGKWIGWQCRPNRQPSAPPTNLEPISKMNSAKKAGNQVAQQGIAKLRAMGIKTTADLDNWIKEHPKTETKGPYKGSRSLLSRYDALKELAGDDAATWILHDLATNEAVKELPKKRGATKKAFDPTLATFVASWVSLMAAKWVGNAWKEKFSGAEQKLVSGAEQMLQKNGIYDLGTLDAYAAKNGQSRYKAIAKLALTNLVLAAAVTFGLSAKDMMSKAQAAPAPAPQQQTQTQQAPAPIQNEDIYIGQKPQVTPQAPQMTKQQIKQRDQQRLQELHQQDEDSGRSPRNVASLNPLFRQNIAGLKSAAPKPTDFEGDTIEKQVANLMERRSFSKGEEGDGWAIYSRNTDYEGDGTWLKVFFKDGKVAKCDMFDEEPENVLDTRLGFEGVFSFTQTYGD